jgi:hypothetical protein
MEERRGVYSFGGETCGNNLEDPVIDGRIMLR